MVVLIFIVSQDAVDALADHGGAGVDSGGGSGVLKGVGELLGEGNLFIELADDQQSSVTGELGRRSFQDDGLVGEKFEDKLLCSL